MSAGAVSLALASAVARAADPSVTPATVEQVAAAVPIEPAVAHWSMAAAGQLAAAIESASAEGLNPRDYDLASLRRMMARGEGAELDAVAEPAALALAHDFFIGRVGGREAMGWMIERSPYEAAQLPGLLRAAVIRGKIADFYRGLLPADARYVALRAALADAIDLATRDRLRANLERARWMPRTLAEDYLYVNVPSYRLAVMSGGQAVSTYTVVVGARDTPTPLMITPATSLVVNPWWNVPESIVRKSNMRPGRTGFQFTALGNGGYAVRQPPGPRNALGRIKVNLVNDQAIYLHDTPAKAGFAKEDRALSHGCVRVKDIDRLAAELLSDDGGALDAALGDGRTTTLRLAHAWPVQIVYFTADVDPTGTVVAYGDPYGYDRQVIAALDGGAVQIASR